MEREAFAGRGDRRKSRGKSGKAKPIRRPGLAKSPGPKIMPEHRRRTGAGDNSHPKWDTRKMRARRAGDVNALVDHTVRTKRFFRQALSLPIIEPLGQ
jgi:hypothetical protein